jgi:hypothetical protein
MATRRVVPSLKYYLQKRNRTILLVIFGLIGLLILGFFAYFIETPEQDILQTIVFIYGIFYAIGLLIVNQRMLTISMYTHYYRMIEENMPPFEVQSHPYLTSFQQQLSTHQFLLGVDRPLYQIHYRLFPRLPYVKRTGLSVIWIVVTKDHIEPYDSRIEDDFLYIKSKIPQEKKIQNEISLVFSLTDSWNEPKKLEAQRIVNFYLQNRAMITIPCVVLKKNNVVYALRPRKQFPNKYYYVAIQFLKEITSATVPHHEK